MIYSRSLFCPTCDSYARKGSHSCSEIRIIDVHHTLINKSTVSSSSSSSGTKCETLPDDVHSIGGEVPNHPAKGGYVLIVVVTEYSV